MSKSDGPKDSLTHLDDAGQARMVDVGAKAETERTATAAGRVLLGDRAFSAVAEGQAPKGDVLAVARIAGIQAAKRTSEWIPLCHPISVSAVEVDITLDAAEKAVVVQATARCVGRTGVEMEAMVAVGAAALTVYDMVKGIDRAVTIEHVRLLHKAGGKSGEWRSE